ncbi:uncharacterized protein DS421_12g368590 [Arachis hypogaea]|nr:uncharacterized protein DS421_12g368590 [Arachis hypogaea]
MPSIIFHIHSSSFKHTITHQFTPASLATKVTPFILSLTIFSTHNHQINHQLQL